LIRLIKRGALPEVGTIAVFDFFRGARMDHFFPCIRCFILACLIAIRSTSRSPIISILACA